MTRAKRLKLIRMALNRANKAIARDRDGSSMYSRGLSSEGFMGGYRSALSDVLLVLESDTVPNSRPDLWDERYD